MNLLIRGGIAVDTDPAPYVIGPADLLIEDSVIAAVGTGLNPPEGTTVIDATGRLVLPGFVDTHRHTWETAIRSIAPDTTLPGYLERVLGTLAPRYRAEDVYAANLAGALECLNAGITTLVDWSHIQLTPAHTEATVEALRHSGIRAVLGYCYGGPDGPAGLAAEGRRVRREYFDGDPLLTMAVAALGPEIAGESRALHEWRLARDLDLPVTVHMGGHGADSAERGLAFLRENDLLDPGTTYVHPNFYTDEALKRIGGSGGTASVSPLIEAELGIGYPATARARAAGVPTGLSADAVTSGPGDMFSLMRAAYVLERARSGTDFTTRDVLRMATAEGAEVAGLGGVTGSLRTGGQADVILVRTDTLAMAPVHDPIAAVTLSADPSCVDTVLVAGRVVKRDGRLLHHDVAKVLDSVREASAQVTG